MMKKLPRVKTFGGGWKDLAESINSLVDSVEFMAAELGIDLGRLDPSKNAPIEDTTIYGGSAEVVVARKPLIPVKVEKKVRILESATDRNEEPSKIPGGATESEYDTVVVRIKKGEKLHGSVTSDGLIVSPEKKVDEVKEVKKTKKVKEVEPVEPVEETGEVEPVEEVEEK